MKTIAIVTVIGIVVVASIIFGLTFQSFIESNPNTDSFLPLNKEEHYQIEITGIKDVYYMDESYSFSYVLSGFGASCGSIDVTYPVNESENITMSSRGLCAESTPKEFVWDVQKERGATFGHVKLSPGNYFVTVEFKKNDIVVSETKSFTVNSLDGDQNLQIESSSDDTRVFPESSPITMTVSISEGSGIPGCETNSKCFLPDETTVSVGTTVIWSNDDSVTHNVTSGILSYVHLGSITTSSHDDSVTDDVTSKNIVVDGPNGLFDSSLLSPGDTFEFTFYNIGSYDYFCMIHPWMTGVIHVS